MHCWKRKVCLLLNNCLAHHVLEVQLKSIQLLYFPPNVSSVGDQLHQLKEVAADLNFEDFLWTDGNADKGTTTALDDEGIV